ncbi:MAG: hypothetical protein RLZZ501_2737 [Pseudomonadota bacterium]|jgi:hypothetical protein
MDRRTFLRLGALAGLGCVAGAAPAAAFQQIDCEESGSADPACRRLDEHQNRLRQLDAALAERGVSDPEQRRQILAAATCPVCGLPLIGSGSGAF